MTSLADWADDSGWCRWWQWISIEIFSEILFQKLVGAPKFPHFAFQLGDTPRIGVPGRRPSAFGQRGAAAG
ncbi:hypothetical protein NYE86_28195 [Actinacidiphila bryophytorum]|nr:hypothetical protein [Actinacidiphila bryophytorum]UWE12187.1 hypothetical protein NYE86_28195 [Actinacidiphila bryophytorum]